MQISTALTSPKETVISKFSGKSSTQKETKGTEPLHEEDSEPFYEADFDQKLAPTLPKTINIQVIKSDEQS